jgi:hypothetical protein
MAISIPRTEAAVIRHFQERMPYDGTDGLGFRPPVRYIAAMLRKASVSRSNDAAMMAWSILLAAVSLVAAMLLVGAIRGALFLVG